MSDKKIVNQLPVVLQTKAIKNFFEATVEQLYSEANTAPLAGFIGKKTGSDVGLAGAFIKEDNADRRQYNLTPAVNNINPITGDSENLIFYDEFIDTLNVYGVNTSNHNKLFGSQYRAFVPPIDIDKFVNYQEYYWQVDGLTTITITGTPDAFINLHKDVLGKKQFTYGTTELRNGMTVLFADNGFTIPAGASDMPQRAGQEYVVSGVGDGIVLARKGLTSSTEYGGAASDNKDYIVQERGAVNKNAWSRVNHWYHRSNFIDAGMTLPDRTYRANRPILEFSKYLELYDHGTTSYGVATVHVTGITKTDIEGETSKTIDTKALVDGDVLLFSNETASNKQYLYTVSGVNTGITLTPTSATPIATEQTVTIADGNVFKGIDYKFNGTDYGLVQRKISTNQAPLFQLYDDAGKILSNNGLYNNSDFAGNRIFGYKVGTGAKDAELGFPVTYTPYKSVSEITFENYIHTDRTTYMPFGTNTSKTILGSYYYKLLKDTPEYHSTWKQSPAGNEQKIITTHYITQIEVDDETLVYNIGAIPDAHNHTPSGYEILVRVNDTIVTDYVYKAPTDIQFNTFTFKAGDVIDVEISSETGISKITDSRYDIPLSWKANPFNNEIELIAEPEYMSHFKKYIERQDGFTGSALGSNNFSNTSKDIIHAKDIVQTDQDLIVAAFALDDQPHNLVESLRFSAREYEKYRARLVNEIDAYYNRFDITNLSKEYILEQVLRSLISFSIGKDVFGTTFVLPFGDNYITQEFDVADLAAKVYTLDDYLDLEEITNSMLVYHVDPVASRQDLLVVDKDYEITSVNPITISIIKELNLGDTVITKLYNEDRDSAECPATPSTMGLFPLYSPAIVTDATFKTPQSLLLGHDGSKTSLKGDVRDEVLLEFEKRLYNSTAQRFRTTDSLPRLNIGDVRAGAFRTTNQSPNEYADLLRNSFTNWAQINKVDAATNDFYSLTDTTSWNYRGTNDKPGHWKGWFEYYYDTTRPHTHPWEMLGFTSKPTWWEDTYGTNTTKSNEALWEDLEQGIIRSGTRENFVSGEYLTDNPWRRIGLSEILPVDYTNNLLTPGEITDTGSTTKNQTWTNQRLSSGFVTDSFKDVAGSSNLPDGINITYGSSNAVRVLFDANNLGNVSSKAQGGTFWDYDGHIDNNNLRFATGFQEGFDGFETPHVFVEDIVTARSYQLFNYTAENLSDEGAVLVNDNVALSTQTIAITVTGTPINNHANGASWQGGNEWFYEKTYRNETVENAVYTITPESAGLTAWSTTAGSFVIGTEYTIKSAGEASDTTNFTLIGAANTNAGTTFTATGTGLVTAGSFVIGESYTIVSAGDTDFTLIGAAKSVAGTTFTATEVGEGTGTANQGSGVATKHSPIVGFAFDGLPIYGPYGYALYDTDGTASDSTITNIKSAFELRTGQRANGPRGNYSGEFIQDYTYNVALGGQSGYVGHTSKGNIAKYNMRWGVTPESPTTPIYFYVATQDDTGAPMFPYAIGGTEDSTNTYSGHYYGSPVEQKLNNIGRITDKGALVALSSAFVVHPSTDIAKISAPWRFGDGAPAENAWKYSVGYPFAVTESILLSAPGRFVTMFSDPLRNSSPILNKNKIINTVDRTPFDFADEKHYCIHGAVNTDGNVITNVGYSQFIHSWLTFQNLNTTTDYADKLKKVNIKLAHRVAGFTDKDTLTVKTDQQSLTSTTNSLLIPSENIDVIVHASPYKNRNFYTGMQIQKTVNGYKVKGFDKNAGYFNVLRRNYTGRTTSVQVGGEAVDFTNWESGVSYQKGTIVEYNNSYYKAPTLVTGTGTFTSALWDRLPSLPQTGAVKGVIYLDDEPYIDRIDYDTEYTTFQEVVDVLVGLGAYQESIGFTFGEFDSAIADVRNWNYVVKQFLFFVAGGWETSNTLELSPLATTVRFTSKTGMVAEINRVDRNQFTLIDQDGRAIQPSECAIVRAGNSIEITPPEGIQIYGALLFTKEIEHALVFDNVTNFNDVLFDPVHSQGQNRLRIKGKKTANWSGLFSSEGFIIQGDELRPNLDNMAQSLGRYHELGFIPVEKQIYEQARGLFGYQEREYLNNLELEDDDQFEFYKGMLQSKGTLPSLSKLAKSKNIISGEMEVYDEWAIKVGDFGDLENDQSIELKLEKSDVIHDPQLITLAFPEDTTGTIDRVNIIDTAHTYFDAPTIEISAPINSPKQQATATSALKADGTLAAINIANAGTGYTTESARLNVVAGELSIANVSTQFTTSSAASTAPVLDTAIAGLSLTNLNITAVAAGASNANIAVSLDISSITTLANIATIVNEDATINSHITANTIESELTVDRGNTTLVIPSSSAPVSAGNFVTGSAYKIVSAGTTDFTAIGSTDSVVGTIFTATGAGIGDGTAQPKVTTVTVTTDIAHGLSVGHGVIISGNINSNVYAGNYTTTAITSNTFDINVNTDYGNIALANATTQGIATSIVKQNILTFIGTDFILTEQGSTLSSLNLTAGRYQPTQRYAIAAVGNHPTKGTGATTASDVTVKVNNEVVDQSYWAYDAGSRQQNAFVILGAGAGGNTEGNVVIRGDVAVPIDTIASENIETIDGIEYPYASVFVEGHELINSPGDQQFDLTTTTLTVRNVENLPTNGLTQGANIFLIEKPTVTFDPSYFDDVPGATLNIKVGTNDNIAIITSIKRLHEITPDLKNDDAILIDIDDTSRFLKKPIGARQQNLWPTTSDVDATGITDAKYISIPNAGYVNSTTVDFSSFDVPSIGQMFRPDIVIHPEKDNLVHVAISENQDWNVYQFKEFESTIKFVEMEADDATAHLYTTESLFTTTTDQNQIASGIDSTRYLDYHIAIKDAVIDNKFVVWVNEQTVNQKQVRLSNITPVTMMEEPVTSIGPRTVTPITNVTPGVSGFAVAEASAADGTGTVTITTSVEMLDAALAGTIGFASGNQTLFEQLNSGEPYTATNVDIQAGTCTITEANVTAPIDAGNLTARFFNRTTITSTNHGYAAGEMIKIVAGAYSGHWMVEGASTDTFMIDTPYLASGPTTGNILLPEFKITTTNDHGMENDYSGKKIAIHNADQRFYNGVYRVKTIPTANTIVVWDSFPFADEANVNVNGTAATTCVVTTLDHNVISLNNSSIKIENINSLPGMIDSLNDTIDTIRGAITHVGSFGLSFPMLKFPLFGPGGVTPNLIGGATPKVTALGNLSKKNLQVTGVKSINPQRAALVGFNKNKFGKSIRKKNPRTVTAAATAGNRSGTLNTTPFNPIIPSLFQGSIPSFTMAGGNFGLGGTGYGGGAINLQNIIGSGIGTAIFPQGGPGMGGNGKPNSSIGVSPAIPQVTPQPVVNSPAVVTAVKVQPTQKPKIRPTFNTGAPILTATAVHVAPVPKCGELIIPVPPRPPQVPNTPANGADDAFSTPFEKAVSGNVLTNDTAGLIKEGSFVNGKSYTIVTTGDTNFVSLGAANNNPGTVFTANGTGLQGGTGEASHPLTASNARSASFGTVTLSSNGDFTYTPNSGYSGSDSWFYDSSDGHGGGSVQQVTITVGQKIPPAPTVYEKCEYQEQSTNAARQGNQGQYYDHFTYMIPASGKVKIIIDMDAATDELEAIQIQQKHQTTGKLLGGTNRTVRKATAAEKNKIKTSKGVPAYANQINNKHAGHQGYASSQPSGNYPRDFVKDGNGIKYCGVVEFNFNVQSGTYLKIKVKKLSSVYRYVICYPTTTNTGTLAPSTPAGNYTGGNAPAPQYGGYKSTPTYNPSSKHTTKKKNTGINYAAGNVGAGGGGWNKGHSLHIGYAHNYGGFSAAPMAGYTHMPSVFKKSVKTVNPQNIGRAADLTNNRYVNNTLQRVSGGRVIPLSAPPQKPIRIANRGINGLNLSQYPGSSHLGNSGTMKNITVAHQILKIGSKNYDLQNLSNPGSIGPGSTNGVNTGAGAGRNGFNNAGYNNGAGAGTNGFNNAGTVGFGPGQGTNGFGPGQGTTGFGPGQGTNGFSNAGGNTPGNTTNIPNFNDAVFTTTPGLVPTIIPGASVYDSTNTNTNFGATLTAPETLSSDDSPIADGIDFTDDPVFTFVPTYKVVEPDGTFKYIPAGPEAVVPVTRPTPSYTFDENDVGSLVPGDEFTINNKSITVKGTPAGTLREIECAQGFGYTASQAIKGGKKAIKISSCSTAPITLRDGCRGGAYKEVLDFHIVRSFQQLGLKTNSFISESDANLVETTTTGTYPVGLQATSTTGQVNTTTTSDGNVITETPATTSNTTFTGGSGYSAGDRLRIVGGTPVASPFGSIRELCIENGGANYTSEANVKVFVGDGTTPGAKSEVVGVTLNSQNGIATIILSEGGYGYDPSRPPVIRIVDVGAGSLDENGEARPQILPAKVRPIIKTEAMNAQGVYVETRGTPDRVAKFEVSAVDPDTGAILGLRVVDRGVYKEFPSDLSTGIPLEYDYPNIGDSASNGGSGLGDIDPITGQKLTDPGAYVPSKSQYGEINADGEFVLFGGSGARVFLTSREIPDCSEKADVLSKLAVPGASKDYSVSQHLADLLNAALIDAGYDPDLINWDINPINDDMDELLLNAPGYDGGKFDELTPGFLDKLGLPIGDYNPDIAALSAVDGTPQNDENLTDPDGISDLINGTGGPGNRGLGNGGIGGLGDDGRGGVGSGGRGGLGDGGIGGLGNGGLGNGGLGNGGPGSGGLGNMGPGTGGLGDDGFDASDATGTELPEETMVIYGVDNGGFNSDGSSMLGGANVTYVGDLYQYELRNLDGTDVNSTNDARNARVLYLESLRYASSTGNVVVKDGVNTNISTLGNVWVDDYEGKGWAYLNIADSSKNRYQEALVDPKYIKNTIVYDSTTGQKDFDYDMWDPFKGVLPAFVDAEITYTGKSDPVVYTSNRAVFGKPNVGQTWWDTSTVRYTWYEQGTNRERWLNWGKTFPGSAITLYEWVESKVTPLEYAASGGTGTPKNGTEFIIERRINPTSNLYENCYYFWVQNVSTISTLASKLAGRKTSTFNLARFLADPIGQGLNTVSFISAGVHERDAVSIANTNVASFVMGNLSKTLREDEQNIQINLSRNINPVGLKHASWKLLRENDNNSIVPEDIALKLIDSLCEIDAAGNKVPADNLSVIERYGVGFRPRQTMFKKPKQARRVLQYILNEILADTKLNTLYPGWDSTLTSNTYVETVNWFDVQRVDDITNEKIRYDATYKASFTVASVKELEKLDSNNIVDGTIVMVKAGKNDRFQLWRWNSTETKFYQIAIEKETAKLKDTIYTDAVNPTMQLELRAFLIALKDRVFTNTANFNEVFFEMMKYALGEQQELDWAFKTSYIYIEKEEEDLVQRVGFKPDNFNSVTEYMNEVKPYTAKIREYKDGKRAPLEYINEQMLSDFDVPAYPDSSIGEVRTLDFRAGKDRAIMANNSDYTKAYGGYKADQLYWEPVTPVRTNKVNIVFDRTDWRLLERDHDASTTSYNVSIGQNIANINADSIANVANIASNSYTASGRLFKFDDDVRAKFNAEIDLYYGDGASANTSITTDATKMQTAVTNGALNGTLYLVKQKVGGTWQGEELDANVFTMGVNSQDSLVLQSAFGYDTSPFDYTDGFGSQFDSMIEVRNFEGIFSGNSTYREGGVTYSGFDGATFSHVLYGDERPEELVYLSPLENFVMHVVTDPIAYENTEITAGAFVIGTEYKIKSIGTTDFTLIGAINNLVGTVFTATDAGIGSGIALEQVLTPIASIGVGPYLTEPTVTVASTAIVADREYTILTPNDTDFTTIGAANSNVGTTFIASGPGTGTGTVSFNNITAGNASGIAGLVTLATPLLLNTDTLILSNDGNSSLSTHMYDMHSSDNANSKILFNTGLYTWDSAAIDNIGNVTLNTAKTASATLANEYDTSAMANVSDTSNIVYANILTTISSSINATDTFYVQGSTNIILDGEYTAAVVDKANNLIQVTSNRLTNANVAIAGNLKVGIKQQAVTTEYIAHQDLFGGDEYLRVLSDGSGSTTTVKEINSWDTEITVLDATKLPIPKPGIPGAAWLDSSERIEYLRVAGNKLSGITRGTRGTTIPNGPAYTYASATSYISDGETITLTDASNTITSGNYVAGNITSNTFTVTANVTSIVNANSNIIIAIDSNDVQETVLSITTHDATNTVTITLPRTNIATLSNTFIKHETGISVVSAGKADVFDASPIQGGTVGFEARDPQDANWLKADGTQRSITDITNRNTGSGSTIAAFLHGDSVSSVGFDSKGWSTVGWDSI